MTSLRSVATFVLIGGVIIAGVGGAFYALSTSTQSTSNSINTTTQSTALPTTSTTSESSSNSTNIVSSCGFTETESSFNVSAFIFSLTYDSQDNLLYGIGAVKGDSQPGLFSINPASDSYEIVANLSSGTSAIAYDQVINAFFVLDSSPNDWVVSVISASSYTVIENISLTFSPSSIFVDPANGQVFVSGPSIIAQILGNVSSPKLIVQSTIVGVAGQFAYNPQNGEVYVAVQNGSAGSILYVINGSTQLITSEISIPLPGFSLVTYDAANGDVYVASSGSSNITRIETRNSYEVFTNISVPYDPMAMAYDPTNLNVYAATNATHGAIYVIDSGTNVMYTPPSSGDDITPQTFLYDPANGVLYMGASGYPPSGIYVISTTPRSLSCLVSVPPSFTVSFSDPYLVSSPGNESFSVGYNFTSNQNTLIFYNGTLGRLVRFSGNPLWVKMTNGSWTPTAASESMSYPIWNVSSSNLTVTMAQVQISANTTGHVVLNLKIGSELEPGYYGLVIGAYVGFQSSYTEIYTGYIPIEVE